MKSIDELVARSVPDETSYHGRWADCVTCRNPFPIFGAVTDTCIPCRKKASGERLSKSDLVLQFVHTFYQRKLDQFTVLLSKAQAKASNSSKEEALKATIRDLETRLSGADLIRRRYEGLVQRNMQLMCDVADLRVELERAKQTPRSDFEMDEVTFLLKLAHPDRHGGEYNFVAESVTKKLIGLRKALRG